MLLAFNMYILNLFSKDISNLKRFCMSHFFLYAQLCTALHSKCLVDNKLILEDHGF